MNYSLQLWWLISLLFSGLIETEVLATATSPDERQTPCRNARVSERDIARGFFQENLGWQRPLHYAMNPITINISLVVSSISEIIERDRTVKFVGHLSLSWYDEFHSWQHSFPHNCISYVVLRPADKVWVPDLAQAFSENKNNLLAHPGERIRVHNDGYTSFTPGGSIVALCEFDLSHYPFDYQKCTVRLESWKYTNKHLKLSFSEPAIVMKQWQENDLWRLVSSYNRLSRVVYTEDAENAYDRVEFIFMLKRKPPFYIWSIVIPNYLLSLGILSIFSLSLVEVLRLQISFLCLFAHSLFQLFLMSDLPRSSDNYPLLAIFVDLQMVFVAILIGGQSCVHLFINWAVPDNESYNDIDTIKLEASLAFPLRCYNSICILGKFLRLQAPFSMIYGVARLIDNIRASNRSGPRQNKSFQHQVSNNFGISQLRRPFLTRVSSNHNCTGGDQKEVMTSKTSFWAFCPSFFGERPSPAPDGGDNIIESLPRGRSNGENGDLMAGDPVGNSGNSNTPVNNAGSMSNTPPSSANNTSARAASAASNNAFSMNITDQSTLRLLLDFRRRLFYFYAQVVDRLTLCVYACCIVLTPFFLALVSASTWRDVTK